MTRWKADQHERMTRKENYPKVLFFFADSFSAFIYSTTNQAKVPAMKITDRKTQFNSVLEISNALNILRGEEEQKTEVSLSSLHD